MNAQARLDAAQRELAQAQAAFETRRTSDNYYRVDHATRMYYGAKAAARREAKYDA